MDRMASPRPVPTAPLSDPTAPVPPGASRGQVIVLFAIFLTAMLGMLGLATDLGYSFVQRRNSQNAADAAALAGALAVLKQVPAQTTVGNTVATNAMPSTTLRPTFCGYVSDGGPHSDLGSCEGSPPPGATGVHVHVEERHTTFFMRLFGIVNTTTSAEATANVQILQNPPADGPFLVCGVKTKLAGNGNATFDLLRRSDGEWEFNKNADGRWFDIHGPQVEDCDAKAERYKGVADQGANRGKRMPDWFNYTEGDTAGPVTQDVQGPGGCKAGQTTNCVMILPVAVNDPSEEELGTNDRRMYTVGWGAFYVIESSPSGNTHIGRFIYDYSVRGGGKPGWEPGGTGVAVIRLTQ